TQGPSAVFPLAPCCSTNNNNFLTLGCLVLGYFPEPVTVTWDTGSLNKTVMTFPAISLGTSGLYATTSSVTAMGAWAKQQFTCSVVHAPSNSHVNKTFAACSTHFSLPVVKLFHSSCDPNEGTSSTVQLLCLISSYSPGAIKVTWLVDGQVDNSASQYTAPAKVEGKLASIQSEFNISLDEWVSERTYTCQVTYRGHIFEDSTRWCTDSEPRGVTAYLSPPSPLELYVHKSPKITCLVVDLASKEHVSLVWSRDSGKPVMPGPLVFKKQYNGTVTVTSTLPVDASDWIMGETYQCKVNHPDLPRDLIRTITKAPGKRVPPEVYVFPPPEEQEQEPRDNLTLTCLIQNFFPADISVQWLCDKMPVQDSQQSTTLPRKAHSSSPTFFVFSRLEVARADWEQNKEFACCVVHEALSSSNRTLEKVVSKKPAEEAGSEEPGGLWTSLCFFFMLFLLSMSYSTAITLSKVR
uniref:Immunoglobulin heavy constant epsilon n=1 Tax=Otolemur garnettii TaxID=30611 RepID=H0X0P0_OTOGA